MPARPPVATLRQVAAEAGFSRPTRVPAALPSRKRVTGRTQQFTTRLTPETYADIYAIADQLRSRAIADVIELAVDRLKADVAAGRVKE